MLPRSSRERVPAGTRVIDVTSARPGRSLSLAVSNPSAVRRIIGLIDALPIVQPGVWSCPLLPAGAPVVKLTFRARADASPLARASQTDYGFDAGACAPMSFSVRGRVMKPLLGGNLLARLQRLLHVRLR